MRWSKFYLFTSREIPQDAEVISHQLMAKAGMIRKVAAGIYSYLPLGWRSLTKMMAIVREEMNSAGAIELSMPSVQPAELWQESGRWSLYGKELLRIKDRHEREFCFGPTHEEVVTDIVRRDVKSYRQLPLTLYQIQNKFRDEIRPRFGLMRGREFMMKDAYSFHTDAESLGEVYESMRLAYCRIFERCGLEYSMVEADTGAIGGSASHEFMVLAKTGESAVVSCDRCDYAANVEKAEARGLPVTSTEEPRALSEESTPGATSVEDVARLLDIPTSKVVKTLIYKTDQGLIGIAIRGDREVNEIKLANYLGVNELALANEESVVETSGAPIGFAGPIGLAKDLRLIGDESVRKLTNFACGANRQDFHFTNGNWGRDVDLAEWADVLLVTDGDLCPHCDGRLSLARGIEVGHIFMLGCKYSEVMGCTFTNDRGLPEPMTMGCYGLGIGRTVAAAIEQNHDGDGIIWPLPLAPFQFQVISLNPDDSAVAAASDSLYEELLGDGLDVFYDDRDARPGVKFKDADLIGTPLRVVLGRRSLADGLVEISMRRDREKLLIPVGDAVAKLKELYAAEGP
ncbi:MAG: proline--tRNA ligase [Thermoanaerobaculia bacterium]